MFLLTLSQPNPPCSPFLKRGKPNTRPPLYKGETEGISTDPGDGRKWLRLNQTKYGKGEKVITT
jgi:hypothetical protein